MNSLFFFFPLSCRSKHWNENFVLLMIFYVGVKCKDSTCEPMLYSTICTAFNVYGRIFWRVKKPQEMLILYILSIFSWHSLFKVCMTLPIQGMYDADMILEMRTSGSVKGCTTVRIFFFKQCRTWLTFTYVLQACHTAYPLLSLES